ncbi:MAG TPA: class I SAM-dependent methyltransferase [Nitrospiria bacterium]
MLASRISELLPKNARVLDVGCGDGLIGALFMKQRPDVSISGIEVLPRKETFIPVKPFNGIQIPHDDKTFDAVVLIDVLHHTDHPEQLLAETKRVSKGIIVLKDHTKKGILAASTLRFMDWMGNAHHGVSLPYNYWTESQWQKVFSKLNLQVVSWDSKIALYPFPANLFFDRCLHFIAILKNG